MFHKKTVAKIVTISAVLILCVSAYLRLHVFSAIQFDSDFGRDSLFAMRILQGKLTLLGPQASVGGFFLGPLYFYLLALLYQIAGLMPPAASLLFIFMGLMTLVIGYALQKKYASKFSSILFLLIACANSVLIIASRSATNQPMMPLVTVLFLWVLMRALDRKTVRSFFLSGVTYGLFFHVHYSALLLLPGYLLVVMFLLKGSIKQKIARICAMCSGCLIMLLPIIIFDVRHKFILIHAFVDYALKTMRGEAISTNLIHLSFQDKLSIFLSTISTQSYLAMFILIGVVVAFYVGKKKITGVTKTYIHMLLLVFLPGLLLFFLYKGYIFSYYLLTVSTVGLLLFSTMLPYIRPRIIPFVLCLIIFIVSARANNAKPAYRIIPNLSRVTAIIEANIDATHPTSSTIFKDSSDQLTGLGYEYRFLLERDKYKLTQENDFSVAEVLYVIREEGSEDPLTLRHWEVSQFNPKYAEEIGHVDFTNPNKNVTVFRLTH